MWQSLDTILQIISEATIPAVRHPTLEFSSLASLPSLFWIVCCFTLQTLSLLNFIVKLTLLLDDLQITKFKVIEEASHMAIMLTKLF